MSFGFGPPRPGVGGLARMLRAPDFCKVDPGLARYFDEQAKVQWNLSPIDGNACRLFADESRLARAIDVAAVTIGVGFVEANATYGCAFVELRLPTTDFGAQAFPRSKIGCASCERRRMISIRRPSCGCTSPRSAARIRHSGVQIRQTSRDDGRRA